MGVETVEQTGSMNNATAVLCDILLSYNIIHGGVVLSSSVQAYYS